MNEPYTVANHNHSSWLYKSIKKYMITERNIIDEDDAKTMDQKEKKCKHAEEIKNKSRGRMSSTQTKIFREKNKERKSNKRANMSASEKKI